MTCNLAEGVGFEPTDVSVNGFQDRRLQPLGHPSEGKNTTIIELRKSSAVFGGSGGNSCFYAGLAYFFKPAHIGLQNLGNNYRAIGLLIVFNHRHECSPHGKA